MRNFLYPIFCKHSYSTEGPLGITSLKKISEEEVAAIENDFDNIEAPTLPSSYKLQPKNQGVLEWGGNLKSNLEFKIFLS